jgi:hypothetical protein
MAYDSPPYYGDYEYDDDYDDFEVVDEYTIPLLKSEIAKLQAANERLENENRELINQLMSTISTKDRMMFELIMAGALTKPKPVSPASPEGSESPESADSSPSQPE